MITRKKPVKIQTVGTKALAACQNSKIMMRCSKGYGQAKEHSFGGEFQMLLGIYISNTVQKKSMLMILKKMLALYSLPSQGNVKHTPTNLELEILIAMLLSTYSAPIKTRLAGKMLDVFCRATQLAKTQSNAMLEQTTFRLTHIQSERVHELSQTCYALRLF